MIDSCRDEFLHPTFTSPTPIPTHYSHQQQRRVYTICPACAAARTLPQAFCQKVQRPQLQTKKLQWMFIMYRFFFPYTRDYILWGSGVSEMDCGVCIFAERRRRRLFLTFQLDALPSWDCITIPLSPCCFSLHIIASAR